MVRPVADGQLTAANRRSGISFAVATAKDDAALRTLLRETPMRGAITIGLEREPNYFRGANIAGARDDTIVAYENDRLLCAGRCTTRDCWIAGQSHRVGYLAELRLHPSASGRVDVLRRGFEFFHALHTSAPAEAYFTSIASDNLRARRLLEHGARGFPRYEPMGELSTLVIATRSAPQTQLQLEAASLPAVADLANASAARANLACVWTRDRLAQMETHDLAPADFQIARWNGAVVGAGAIWDQRSFRQIVIRGYTPWLAVARPLLNAFARHVRMSRLPGVGAVLSHAFLSPLVLVEAQAHALPELVAALCAQAAARRIEFVSVALPSQDDRVGVLRRRFRCRVYSTRLYAVSWPNQPSLRWDSRPVLPEVALL